METSVQEIPVEKIQPSPFQVRKDFDEERIKELAQTIQAHGLMNAINVRPVGDHFELIAGERRWRAAKILGWATIRSQVETVDDQEAAQRVLVENVQRQDLNPIERAQGYKKLEGMGLTQAQIGDKVGQDQTTVARVLSLLDLPGDLQDFMTRVINGEGQTRHLRKIQDTDKRIKITQQAEQEGWSVKDTEQEVNKLLGGSGKTPKTHKSNGKSAHSGDSQPSAPDPLADSWEDIQGKTQGWIWVVECPQKLSWQFTVNLENMDSTDPKQTLGQWFLAMATAFGEIKPDADTMQQLNTNNMVNASYMEIVKQAMTPPPAGQSPSGPDFAGGGVKEAEGRAEENPTKTPTPVVETPNQQTVVSGQ